MPMKTATPSSTSLTRSTTRTALYQRLSRLGSARSTFRPAVIPVRPAYAVKVVLDYILASALLLLAIPVIAAGMLLVKLSSPGPALYTQTRVGRGGRNFTIFKIRTMTHNCELLTGPQWSQIGDVRITRVGKVLRNLHVDENPGLLREQFPDDDRQARLPRPVVSQRGLSPSPWVEPLRLQRPLPKPCMRFSLTRLSTEPSPAYRKR